MKDFETLQTVLNVKKDIFQMKIFNEVTLFLFIFTVLSNLKY